MTNAVALGIRLALSVAFIAGGLQATAPQSLPAGLKVVSGPVNGAFIQQGEKTLVVYGDPQGNLPGADTVLFTHHRRDVVWAGRSLVERGAEAIVPAGELDQFTAVAEFWASFREARFHDYAQQTTKLLSRPLAVTRTVRGGDTLDCGGLNVRVLATPGYTRGAVTYLMDLAGKKVAFTGDLIYGDGQLWDLYSLQDAIPEAGIGGYHGYAARLAAVVDSLDILAREQPDLLVPARGPLIHEPARAIERLRHRIRACYANYLSIDALRWYFGDDHIRAKARRVLGPETEVDWMALAETVETNLPPWVEAIDNARLIRATDGSGFLIDCGSARILNTLKNQQTSGTLKSVDHLFISHYHDDHTEQVPALLQQFASTVYACPAMVDILQDPNAYRLPAMTARSIPVSVRLVNGATWRWKEFQLTAFDFPGQTRHHQALLVTPDQGASLCFIGDSFTPAGIDDYCLLNRNLLHPDMGYFRCFNLIRDLPEHCLLINQHVGPAFRFSPAQLDRMEATLKARVELLRELVPWDDPNFALDEGWARFRPYALQTKAGETAQGTLRIMNHSPDPQAFRARLNAPPKWIVAPPAPDPVRIPPRQEGAVHFSVTVPEETPPGLHILTADIEWGGTTLREWTEVLIEVPAAEPADKH